MPHPMGPDKRFTQSAGDAKGGDSHAGRPWLGVYFHCCQVYGRIYKTKDGVSYEGGCPRCGATVSAMVGPKGTARRMFEAS